MGDAREICCKPEVRFLTQGVMSRHRRMVIKDEEHNEKQVMTQKQKPDSY